ncbi:hypothetical protein ACTMU2_37435 [Cupriavidus basilensis]
MTSADFGPTRGTARHQLLPRVGQFDEIGNLVNAGGVQPTREA